MLRAVEDAGGAFLESPPDLADALRQPATDLRAEDAQPDEEQDEADGEHEADDEERVDLGARASPERPEAGGQRQDGDDDEVRDPLDEHGAQRPRDGRSVVRAQQEGPIEVAQLGGNQAVDEPRQEQDLGGIPEAKLHPAARQDVLPAKSPHGKRGVVHREGEDQEAQVGLADELRDLAPVEVVAEDDASQEVDEHQAEEQRRHGAHVEQPPADRDLLEADLLSIVAGRRRRHRPLAFPSSPCSGSGSGQLRLGRPLDGLLADLLRRARARGSGPVAAGLPRHASNAFFQTAQRVVAWMNTLERLACHSFSGSAAFSSAAVSNGGQGVEGHRNLEAGVGVGRGDARDAVSGRELGRLLVVTLEASPGS